jgi:hypothetical protein
MSSLMMPSLETCGRPPFQSETAARRRMTACARAPPGFQLGVAEIRELARVELPRHQDLVLALVLDRGLGSRSADLLVSPLARIRPSGQQDNQARTITADVGNFCHAG